MKKTKSVSNNLRAKYKRSDFKKLERGKYYERVKDIKRPKQLKTTVAFHFRVH